MLHHSNIDWDKVFTLTPMQKTQVQAAAINGKVKNLGHFSVDAGGCGNYSQDMTDRNIVIQAIKAKLNEMGANVADNVVAIERWYDFLLGLFIIPDLAACTNWTVSGEALVFEEGVKGGGSSSGGSGGSGGSKL